MPAEPLDLKLLTAACVHAGFPEPAREHRFAAPDRQWRFDLAWPALMVAFEREGMAPRGQPGRHQRAEGYRRDCEKYNAAARMGWLVVRGTGRMIADGSAAADLLAVLEMARRRPADLDEIAGVLR